MYLDLSTIKEKYDGNWIFLINCKSSTDGTLEGGEIVCASSNRVDVVESIKNFKSQMSSFALKYIGEAPKEGRTIVW